jgi:hypothetical protein
MKTYQCDGCGNLIFFENVICVNCSHPLGFIPGELRLCALEPAGNETWRPLASAVRGQLYRKCANEQQHQICNWMVTAEDKNQFCVSCQLTEIIPDLTVAGNKERWHRLEMAKRRVVFTLLRLGLPMEGAGDEKRPPLRFRFLGDVAGGKPMFTGHENGLITINIAEADDDERERRRVSLHEPYRTLLGHLRHEVSHYYWDRLIANSPWLSRFRALFGDENRDYGADLQAYYQQGPSADWQSKYVSAYASSHPWEDWAETCAHYFHIIDTVETAASFGMTLKPKHPAATSMTADLARVGDFDSGFDLLLKQWFPLTYALNSLNRGMGLHDLYPFVLSNAAIEKLRFIHEVVHTKRTS